MLVVVLNTGSPTKLNNWLRSSYSAVDISLCSPAWVPYFDGEVGDDTLGFGTPSAKYPVY